MLFHKLFAPKWKLSVACVYVLEQKIICFISDANASLERKKHLLVLIDPDFKSAWDLFVGQKHFNNACDYRAS